MLCLGLYMTLLRAITAVHHLAEIADAMHVSNRKLLDRCVFKTNYYVAEGQASLKIERTGR